MKAHILGSITFFENCVVYEIVGGKYGRARQATDGGTAHALCVLDT
jgi:hypothetical protein